jgi:hypothetical protein
MNQVGTAEPGPDGAMLQRLASDAGHEITDRMLETFRAQGLLPRPRRAGQSGRAPDWRYPAGTEQQLLALLEWRRQTKQPDLLTVLLWLDGFEIGAAAVRAALTRQLRKMIRAFEQEISQQAVRLGLDPDDRESRRQAIDKLAQTMAAKRGTSALPRRGRMRAGERSSALGMIIRLFGLGESIEATPADAAVVERALGVAPNGRRHRIFDADPWLTGPAEDLFAASSITGLPALLQAVETSTDAGIAAARQTIIGLVYHLPLMIRMIGVMFGDENYMGLGNLGQMDGNPDFVMFFAPMVIAMQRAGWDENLKMITAGLATFPEIASQAQRILEMPAEVVRANMAGQTAEQKRQAQRLIEAALEGKLDNHAAAAPSDRPRSQG